jgi:hypothetical protein
LNERTSATSVESPKFKSISPTPMASYSIRPITRATNLDLASLNTSAVP